MSAQKPMANPEKAKQFGEILRDARYRHTTRMALLTPKLIAAHLDISTSLYYKYEEGSRTIKYAQLLELREFYGHDRDTWNELLDKYHEFFGKRPEREPLLKIVARRQPKSFLDEVARISIAANALYEEGQILAGHEMASRAWDIAKQSGVTGRALYSLCLVLARFQSQLNNHRNAIQNLIESSERAAEDREPEMHCSTLLTLAACRARAEIIRGMPAAREYGDVIDLVRLRCKQKAGQMSPEWAWIWCDAHRSRILTLSTTLDDSDSQFIRYLWPEFDREVQEVSWLNVMRESVKARVDATIHDPCKALADLDELSQKANKLAEHTYHATSRVIAMQRQGDYKAAVESCEYWASQCRDSSLLHKQKTFLRLRKVILKKAGKEVD